MNKLEEIVLHPMTGTTVIKIETPIGDRKGYKHIETYHDETRRYIVADKDLEEFAIKILSALGYKIR